MVAKREPVLGWTITDHCCRVCFSRVLMREAFDHRRTYRCAGCGAEAEGSREAVICSCGIRLKTGVDAGIRCTPNAERSPEWPAEITATQATLPGKK